MNASASKPRRLVCFSPAGVMRREIIYQHIDLRQPDLEAMLESRGFESAERDVVTARDWLQIRGELDELLPGDAERPETSEVSEAQLPRVPSFSEDALMRHVADALRGSEIGSLSGDTPRARPRPR